MLTQLQQNGSHFLLSFYLFQAINLCANFGWGWLPPVHTALSSKHMFLLDLYRGFVSGNKDAGITQFKVCRCCTGNASVHLCLWYV